MKIVTLTLNPCIDRTISISGEIRTGATHRVEKSRAELSGKGLNISYLLHNWKEETYCLGIDYEDSGFPVTEKCNTLDIPYQLAIMQGEIRTNIKVFDKAHKTMTEFNEKGALKGADRTEEILQMADDCLEDMEPEDILVCTGSVPQGIADTIYRDILLLAQKKKIRTVLDASGTLLKNAISTNPTVMKPNAEEIAELLGHEPKDEQEIVEYAKALIKQGVSYICVTLGAQGAILVSAEGVWKAEALDVEVRGIQGSGDSVVAGMCVALGKGLGEEEILRYGIAAAGGSLMQEGTQMCRRSDFEKLLSKVQIRKQ
jgi:1-phosphofructokinase